MMGSTSNALDKGGANFKKLYEDSDVTKRNRNGQTSSGLYSLFIPMEWNYEGFIDTYGNPVFDTPQEPAEGPYGELIDQGVIEHWQNEVDGLKNDQDGLNETATDRLARDYILCLYLWNGITKDSLILMETLSLIHHKNQLKARMESLSTKG